MESNWITHYIIIEKNGPVSYTIRNQLTGVTKKAHANSLRQSKVLWEVPKQTASRHHRNAQLVETPPSDSDIDNEELGEENHDSNENNAIETDSTISNDSDDTIIYDPRDYRASVDHKIDERLNEGPSLSQLQKQIRYKRRENYSSDETVLSDSSSTEDMEISGIQAKEHIEPPPKKKTKPSKSKKIKSLLAAVADLLD